MRDDLGDRIKSYEASSKSKLVPKLPVMIRIDGKAFHTFTKRIGALQPFDKGLHGIMEESVMYTMANMQGAKLGYCQSDEASILLTDYETHVTQPWFGYDLQKVVSVAASLFTGGFYDKLIRSGMLTFKSTLHIPAFDARAFNLPEADVTNYFLWRIRDAERNSLNNLARCELGHKAIQGKNRDEVSKMLYNIDRLRPWVGAQKSGSFIFPDGRVGVPDSENFSTLDKQISHLFLTRP